MTATNVHFSSEDMAWRTPPAFFAEINREFGFTLDAAASSDNALCGRFFTAESNGLGRSWEGEVVWVNPPYGRALGRWIAKAAEEAEKGTTIVMLIPARPDTRAWHTHIFPNPRAEVRFLKGRLKFCDSTTGEPMRSAPFPSALIVFNGGGQ